MSEIFTDEDGTKHCILPEMSLSILPDGESKVFLRNAIKLIGGRQEKRRYIVGELDGVRVYIEGASVIMTKQDLYP